MLCEFLQFSPSPTGFSGTVTAAAQQQKVSVISERKAFVIFVHEHPIHPLGILQCQHIGTALVHFQKVGAVLIIHREMRGDDDLFRHNRPPIRLHCVSNERFRGGLLIDL